MLTVWVATPDTWAFPWPSCWPHSRLRWISVWDSRWNTCGGRGALPRVVDLEARVKSMYEPVAGDPFAHFHFETGRALAERLGYPAAELDRIPAEVIASFAGVGYFLDLAGLTAGETVLDLGSGSGTNSFLAVLAVGAGGNVIGIDMTAGQLDKARRLSDGIPHIDFRAVRIDAPPVPEGAVDCVISNGVINLGPDKAAVFSAAHRRG